MGPSQRESAQGKVQGEVFSSKPPARSVKVCLGGTHNVMDLDIPEQLEHGVLVHLILGLQHGHSVGLPSRPDTGHPIIVTSVKALEEGGRWNYQNGACWKALIVPI
jgi:hypothetical protein